MIPLLIRNYKRPWFIIFYDESGDWLSRQACLHCRKLEVL